MVHFEKLRLNGFKSFVDRTELDIGPGLNGVVGPNGCGKSNLLEALRWVMGENSPKRMRGGGMEDVIFNGTADRAARNVAEVALLLNNESREAPAAYNGSDEIEIIRRIEKDHGSQYKINGKNVRARDVQMLFADTVTGANSPAMVSQGRITAIINAKPQERRQILEESAGIAGLYARRHEAELRLRAASTNLTRLEDILGGIEKQLGALKRQARQAGRYRNINAQIRQLDILIAYLEWRGLAEKQNTLRSSLTELEQIVAEKMASVAQLTKTQTTQAEELPELRKKETEAAANLQTKRITLQRIEDEVSRIENLKNEATDQLAQSTNDHHHEKTSLEENAGLLQKIEIEEKELSEQQDNSAKDLAHKERAKDELYSHVEKLEESYAALMENTAQANARQEALESSLKQERERKEKHEKRLAALLEEQEKLKETNPSDSLFNAAEKDLKTVEEQLKITQSDIKKKEEDIDKKEEKIHNLNVELQEFKQQRSKINAELELLEKLLSETEGGAASVLDQTQASPGFEKALSRALGDSLMASLDDTAKHFWQSRKNISSLPALPGGIKSILPHIQAPKALALSLGQIGYVESFEEGQAAFSQLAPGQSIVSKDGHYWRWDGYCIKASAADRNAQHLEYKNKFEALQKKAPALNAALKKAENVFLDAEEALTQMKAEKDRLEQAQDDLEKLRAGKIEGFRKIENRRAYFESENRRLDSMISTAQEDLAAAEEQLKSSLSALENYTNAKNSDQQEHLEDIKAQLIETREKYQDALRKHDMHEQQQKTRQARLHAINDERLNLKNRIIRSKQRIETLEKRISENKEKLEGLQEQPASYQTEKDELLSAISELEKIRDAAAEKLSVREQEVMETSRALKEAENALGEAREKRAHAQATFSALENQIKDVEAAIEEKFDMPPRALPEHAAMDIQSAQSESLSEHKEEREKLVREREAIGPVNLRAEEEAKTLEEEVGTMLSERNDLSQAIEELQHGIQKINKEAREKLLAAFHHVNGHFQNLFKRLFNGGEAELALIESDDPLGAGLEIFAQPPGKSLQALSLLSGGEQTMASIALIFAMFLTNPSPICVLDEIDAPLDDANVDRVCDLLEEIAERRETRFMIITHHRLTMARMDRLYGVTMAEKGVSQLVSVDLQQSFQFLDEAA